MKALEKSLQNEILRTFGTIHAMRIWRANTGVAVIDGRTVRFGVPGQADLTGILPGGVRLEIEVKSPTGVQSKDQKSFQRIIAGCGGVYVIARSLEDVWRAVDRFGIVPEGLNHAEIAAGTGSTVLAEPPAKYRHYIGSPHHDPTL